MEKKKDKGNPEGNILGLKAQLDAAGYKEKRPLEVYLKFTLPPPTYKSVLTSDASRTTDNKTKGLVKELRYHPHGICVVDSEGTTFVVPHNSINYIVEES